MYCSRCGSEYPIINGIPVLMDQESLHELKPTCLCPKSPPITFGEGGLRTSNSKIINRLAPPEPARFYGSLEWQGIKNYHIRVKEFLESFPSTSIVVDIGSGGRQLPGSVVNLDIDALPHVALVGDAHKLPFLNDSLDGVVIQQVLEHVPDPFRVVLDVYRVLKPGGRVYCDSPFMYPVHGKSYYSDYYRFTKNGLAGCRRTP